MPRKKQAEPAPLSPEQRQAHAAMGASLLRLFAGSAGASTQILCRLGDGRHRVTVGRDGRDGRPTQRTATGTLDAVLRAPASPAAEQNRKGD